MRRGCGRRTRCRIRPPTAAPAGRLRSGDWWRSYLYIGRPTRRWRDVDKRRVALMQPTFLPWQGFFALVAFADVFVFLDDFQFQRHSFHQRNRLRVGDGTDAWVTV